jgi:hypothetical protein
MNKRRQVELDVDFIGGERSLTKEDEKAISDFLKQRKMQSKISAKVKKIIKVRPSKVIA